MRRGAGDDAAGVCVARERLAREQRRVNRRKCGVGVRRALGENDGSNRRRERPSPAGPEENSNNQFKIADRQRERKSSWPDAGRALHLREGRRQHIGKPSASELSRESLRKLEMLEMLKKSEKRKVAPARWPVHDRGVGLFWMVSRVCRRIHLIPAAFFT